WPPDAPLPLDPAVQTGVLPNGLRWYVSDDDEPRWTLRLVVRAGSVLEDDDQRGAAHLLEHLAFTGTAHLPGDAFGTWLAATGSPYGPHVDAHAAFDETTFQLRVAPDDGPTALQVLADWASGLHIDPDAIDALRPALAAEWDQPSIVDDATVPI